MVFGVCGKARSGKDTVSKVLAEELFKEFKSTYMLFAYATELKNRVQRDFDLGFDQLWGDEKDVVDRRYKKRDGGFWTPREILQNYGEFFRSIDVNYWVKALFDVIDNINTNNVIITDVRHKNEVDPIIERSGYLIKVENDRGGLKGDTAEHVSETGIDSFNYDRMFILNNNSSLDHLRLEVVSLLEKINLREKRKNG